MSLETLKQTQLGRQEIKRIAEAGKSGAVLSQQSVADAHDVMTHGYDADNRNGMGKRTVGDAITAERTVTIHEHLSPVEQKGIEEGSLHVLVDFGGNVTSRPINAE